MVDKTSLIFAYFGLFESKSYTSLTLSNLPIKWYHPSKPVACMQVMVGTSLWTTIPLPHWLQFLS